MDKFDKVVYCGEQSWRTETITLGAGPRWDWIKTAFILEYFGM